MQNQQPKPNLDGRMSLFSKGGKDIFGKAYEFMEADLARQMNIYPYYQTIDRNEGSTCIIEGKEVIMLGSNNYLGLTIHPEVRAAAMKAINDYGTSLTGSRLMNGTHLLHENLEKELAEFLGKEACLVFTTGYQANLGVLSALMNKGTVAVMDKADHASIYDGIRLAKGDSVGFNHNDMKDLDRSLSEIDSEIGKLIIVDGVFSMEGDIANLTEIQELAAKYQTRLAVDDAHALGVLGRGGRGTADHFNLVNKVDLIIGTFSKTLASIGGYVVGDHKVIDFIKHFGRSIIFSASLPPASIMAAQTALQVLKREPERVERVNANAHYMHENLRSLGFDIGHTQTPIIPIMIGDEILTLTLWRELLDAGVYINPAVYPAVPRERSLLRTSVTSEHTREQLDKTLEILVRLKKKHNW